MAVQTINPVSSCPVPGAAKGARNSQTIGEHEGPTSSDDHSERGGWYEVDPQRIWIGACRGVGCLEDETSHEVSRDRNHRHTGRLQAM